MRDGSSDQTVFVDHGHHFVVNRRQELCSKQHPDVAGARHRDFGRGLERYDKRTVKGVTGRLADHDYRFSALVLEIVNSLPFQMRRRQS